MEPALLSAAIKAVFAPAATVAKNVATDQYAKLASKFQAAFKGHLDFTEERCSKVKNILYRDDTVSFKSQYVNVSFLASKKKTISDARLVSKMIEGSRVLVCGTAGAGKTMFLRWSALRLIDGVAKHGRIPLYLEMRYLEEDCVKEPLERYLYDKTSSVVDASGYATFLEGLKTGVFVLLFDALDEVNPRFRPKLVSRIVDFLRSYPRCGFAASTRQDEKLESLQEFRVYRTLPMTQGQIVQVIRNLEWSQEVKDKLVERLEGGLYNQLSEFLSNPLLATIMLLAFDYSGDIPTKLTAFYQQAFDALYQRHDAAKGAYKRDHYAGLPIDRFENIFSTFSFQSYLDYKFEFSDGELESAFRDAVEYNQEDVDPTLIIQDCKEAVCLIQREGLANTFSHRSFQEYFCALFVSRYRETDVGKLIDAIASLEARSNVLKMLYQLSPEVVEYEWILPLLKKFISDFGRLRFSTKTGLAKVFSGIVASIVVDPDTATARLVSWGVNRDFSSGFAGRWISVVSAATEGKLPSFLGLHANPLWDSLDDISVKLGDEGPAVIEKIKARMFHPDSSDGEPELSLGPKDSIWLIHSNLPAILENLRSAVRQYHDDIIQRRAARGATVKGLLTKPRSKRFRP